MPFPLRMSRWPTRLLVLTSLACSVGVLIQCARILHPKDLSWAALSACVAAGTLSLLTMLLAACATGGKRPWMLKCTATMVVPLILLKASLAITLFVPSGMKLVIDGAPDDVDRSGAESKLEPVKFLLAIGAGAELLLIPMAHLLRGSVKFYEANPELSRQEERKLTGEARSSAERDESSERMDSLRGYAAEQKEKREAGRFSRKEQRKARDFDSRMSAKYGANWQEHNDSRV